MADVSSLLKMLEEHQVWHNRLAAGEYNDKPEQYDEDLGAELDLLVAQIGVKRVGNLLHLVMELVIQAEKHPNLNATEDDYQYMRQAVLHFVETFASAMMAAQR